MSDARRLVASLCCLLCATIVCESFLLGGDDGNGYYYHYYYPGDDNGTYVLEDARRLSYSAFTGFTAIDEGALDIPTAASISACCMPTANSMAYSNPVKELKLVAGLPYQLNLVAAGTLSDDVRLRLMQGSSISDKDCTNTSHMVTDYAEGGSPLNGTVAPDQVTTSLNRWSDSIFPHSGTFSACYNTNASEVDDTDNWRVLVGVKFTVYGAPHARGGFFCAAKNNSNCLFRVGADDPKMRATLVSHNSKCGESAAWPNPKPYNYQRSVTDLDSKGGAWHSLGVYLLADDVLASYRVCFCPAFEYDNNRDNKGLCSSFTPRDFVQPIGYLYTTKVATPQNVYPRLSFDLRVHCGDPAAPGCNVTGDVRIKLVDSLQLAAPGSTPCTVAPQSQVFLYPSNCAGPSACDLQPTTSTPEMQTWYGFFVGDKYRNNIVGAYRLDACYCDGGHCDHWYAWAHVGNIVVHPIVVSPDPFPLLVQFNLELKGAAGSWSTAGAASRELKVIWDPAGAYTSSDCFAAVQTRNLIENHHCDAYDCQSPTSSSSNGQVWQNIVMKKAGFYTICYCDRLCNSHPEFWGVVKWHVVAGPASVYVGTVVNGPVVYTGARFELTVQGFGLSTTNRVRFVPNKVGACSQVGSSAEPIERLEADAPTHKGCCDRLNYLTPVQLGVKSPNTVVGFTGSGSGTTQVAFTVAHGLSVNDRVRFSNLTVITGKSCPTLWSSVTARYWTHCIDALQLNSVEVTSVPSANTAILAVNLTAAEAQDLDTVYALWQVTSKQTYEGLRAPLGLLGEVAVCWAQNPSSLADYVALAGVITVQRPPTFRSQLHLTSTKPDVEAPSILAFELGNRAKYTEALAPTYLKIIFRNSSKLRHAYRFSVDEAFGGLSLDTNNAALYICGNVFKELWSSHPDGFPQPSGCFYNEALHEYYMVFPPKAGLKGGYQYQMVIQTLATPLLSTDLDWMIGTDRAPFPVFQPHEQRFAGFDAGVLPTISACTEACARASACNVVLWEGTTTLRCFLADLSGRGNPYLTNNTRTAAFGMRGDVTAFAQDRLNSSHAQLWASWSPRVGGANTVMDMWSMDDVAIRPNHAIEYSAVSIHETVGNAAMGAFPQWHVYEGLQAVGTVGQPLHKLDSSAPSLSLRIRARQSASIVPGAIIRLFFWPLLQWDLADSCVVSCTPDILRRHCGQPACATEAVVKVPWKAGRNVMRLTMSGDMDPITNDAVHTVHIQGTSLPLPTGGFFPTKFAGQLRLDDSTVFVDYMESTGPLLYLPVKAIASVIATDGNAKPFRGDAGNVIYVKLQLGSVLHAGGTQDAQGSLSLLLPNGYMCMQVREAPTTLKFFQNKYGPQGRGSLPNNINKAGQWVLGIGFCTYKLVQSSVIYGGSSLVFEIELQNPSWTMPARRMQSTHVTENTWKVRLQGAGAHSQEVVMPVTAFTREGLSLSSNSQVLGKLLHTSLTPSLFWMGAADNDVQVFFQTEQSSRNQPALVHLTAPEGFGFYAVCEVKDLPLRHYAPLQSFYTSESIRTHPLGISRSCRAARTKIALVRPNRAEISLPDGLEAVTMYGFVIRIMHPSVYNTAQQNAFMLETFSTDHTQPLDRSESVPLLDATRVDFRPSYGLYKLHPGRQDALQVRIAQMLPYGYTQSATEVFVFLRTPFGYKDVNPRRKANYVSWRVFAPTTYRWDFNENQFKFKAEDVPGANASLPVRRIPAAPGQEPFNRLVFKAEDEFFGWDASNIFGFGALIRIPSITPRSGPNLWIVEWGFAALTLDKRMSAAVVEAQEVRALHSLAARSLVTRVEGRENIVHFQIGMVTAVPKLIGAIIIDAPPGFVFEESCVPIPRSVQLAPWETIKAQLLCTASATGSDTEQGTLRPRITITPYDVPVPEGMYEFSISCINPMSAVPASSNTFIFQTFLDLENGQVADVAAPATSFDILKDMRHAEIVHEVDRLLTGRDDRPEKSSSLVFAFELRRRPVTHGDVVLQVDAPEGFIFSEACEVVIGANVFGIGQPYPEPYRPFEDTVQVRSCTGILQQARIVVSSGLLANRRYAFRLAVGMQPSSTPIVNQWGLRLAEEASLPINGFPLWALANLLLGASHTSISTGTMSIENSIMLFFTPTNTLTFEGLIAVEAPSGYKIRLGCQIGIDLLSGSGLVVSSVPGVYCEGELPPVNTAKVKFQAEGSTLKSESRYRMSMIVTNPDFIGRDAGHWTLQSYSDRENIGQGTLLDSGRVKSVPLSLMFALFQMNFPIYVRNDEHILQLTYDFALPHPIIVGDAVELGAPQGYEFATGVYHESLNDDLRQCFYFQDRTASAPGRLRGSNASLPRPLCAGNLILFVFQEPHGTGDPFRLVIGSIWPKISLLDHENMFKAKHIREGHPQPLAAATVAKGSEKITPRLLDLVLVRVGPRSEAVGSYCTMNLIFRNCQAADALEVLTTDLPAGGLFYGMLVFGFTKASFEVVVEWQLLKKVTVARQDAHSFLLLMSMVKNTTYHITIRNVLNPSQNPGRAYWQLRTFVKPVITGQAVPLNIQLNLPERDIPNGGHGEKDPLLWMVKDRIRDELVDVEGPLTVGAFTVHSSGTLLQDGFFDFVDTSLQIHFTIGPKSAEPNQILVIFAPDEWSFVSSSFQSGDNFPKYRDLGNFSLRDPIQKRFRLIYAVELLNEMRSSSPCSFNPALQCPFEMTFSVHVNTPDTPRNLPLWLNNTNPAWLIQIVSPETTTTTSAPPITLGNGSNITINVPSLVAVAPSILEELPRLDLTDVHFSNDALFQGFKLKESLGKPQVVPEPGGQMSRQKTTVAVYFNTKSALIAGATGGVFLKLSAPLGFEFPRGCLTVIPDPDYLFCNGAGSRAVLKVREGKMAEGEQKLVIRVTNAYATPEENFWMLESFVGKTAEEAWMGRRNDVRQRGVGAGYEIVQGLEVILTPTSTEVGVSVLLHVWFRTRVPVPLGGFLELHIAMDFSSACEPLVMPVSIPPSRCRSFVESSGLELRDLHTVLELKFEEEALLPNTEYEFIVHVRNPRSKPHKLHSWGMRLREGAERKVIEANMQVSGYPLTDYGLSFASLIASSTLPLAMSEIRIILDFRRRLSLTGIQDIRILAPPIWELICIRYQDITGGDQKTQQLPYSMERGHHRCPSKYSLLLLLDQLREIKAARYVLLIGAMNPARGMTKDLWSVSLLSPADNLGWTPTSNVLTNDSDPSVEPGYTADAMKTGQQVLAQSFILGFGVHGPYEGFTVPPQPLAGQIVFESNLGRQQGTCHVATVCLWLVAVFNQT